MTVRELIQVADQNAAPALLALAAIPAASFVVGRLHGPGEGGRDPWRRLYALLVYAAAVPGMFSASLVLYSLFFTGENLLNVSLLVYFAPLATMTAALAIMRSSVDFDQVPGFDKLGGLLGVLGVSFTLALVVQKTRIFVVFAGSMWMLVALAAGLFAALRWSARRVLGPGSPARP